MAAIATEVAVALLLENLQQLLAAQAALLAGVQDDVEWIRTEFRLMIAHQESVMAQHQLSENEEAWVEKTRSAILRAQGLVETYAKRASKFKMAAWYKKPIHARKVANLNKELVRIKDEILQVRQGWRSVDLAVNTSTSPQYQGLSAMAKVDSALKAHSGIPLLKRQIEWVRDELVPLHDFLQQIDQEPGIQELGERQKIWIQELRDIFHFIDRSFPSIQRVGVSRENGAKKWLFFILSCCLAHSDQIKLGEVLSEIQPKILQLYRRYYAYGFGEILVNDGSRSIFPRIRMSSPIPDVLGPAIYPFAGRFLMRQLLPFIRSLPAIQREMKMTYSSWLTPGGRMESLRVDLKLMKALLEDTRSMRDLDERVKVWLNQVLEISVDLEALEELANNISQGREGVFRQISNRMEMACKLRHIRLKIHDLASRKMTYGIGSSLGEAGQLESIPACSFIDETHRLFSLDPTARRIAFFLRETAISKAEISRRVESVRKELQLMQALVEDAKKMNKLDARLRFWVEEMQGIAQGANASVELGTESLYSRIKATLRVNRIRNHILIMSSWKQTFDIDVKSRRHAGILSHNSEESVTCRFEAIKGVLDLARREIKFIEALDKDIGEIDGLDGKSKAWVEEMRKIAEQAKSLIDAEGKNKNGDHPFKRFYRVRLDRMKNKIRQLSDIRMVYGVELRQRLPPNTVHQIKAKLLADHGHSCIIPILGMTSTQKEALQDLFNEDTTIIRHFDWQAWMHVPEEITATSVSEYVADQIVEQLKAQFQEEELRLLSEGPKDEKLLFLLQHISMHKRCLIVLDEIQRIEVWQSLEPYFQQISSNSRIILVSNKQTCSSFNSTFDAIDVNPGSDASSTDDQSVPSYLRHCLYYFLLFPAKFEVPARRLIVLWVAEGLVHPNEDEENGSVEHIAYSYLKELIRRGMVRVTNRKPNGEPKACQLSEKTRDSWLEMAKKANFFQDAKGIPSRLVDHNATPGSCFIHINGNNVSPAEMSNYRNVLSFLSFNSQEGSKAGESIGVFLRKCISAGCFRWTKVLDLERVFRPELPKALSKLTLLSYLGLRWTYLEHLPKYVSTFLNLQVLDVKHTYISVLPKSIWRMQYLRHLYLSEIYRTRFPDPPSDVSLNELQTLWGTSIDEDTCVTEGLDTLLQLRKLGLSCRPSSSSGNSRTPEQLKAVDKWISKLEFLESLRLKSRDTDGEAAHLHLNSLEKNTKLWTVYLLGKLNPLVVCTFPRSLIDITLSGSELDMDPMEFLGKLPHLQILWLLAQSVAHDTMVCCKNSFPELRVLKIWNLEKLKKWEAEEGSLQCLEELEIRSCEYLEKLPDQLQCVEKLEIVLKKMPNRFKEDARSNQPQLWAKVKQDP